MKWVGAVVLTVAGICMGASAVCTQHRRKKILQQTITWLHDFERRLQYASVSLREWLACSAARYPELAFVPQTVSLLQTADLETAFKHAVQAMKDFGRAETEILCALGTHLGKSDTSTQLQCVRETISALEERREAVTLAVQKADKLYLTLGTSGGLALALLLI